jgi:hypothetical protein
VNKPGQAFTMMKVKRARVFHPSSKNFRQQTGKNNSKNDLVKRG